MEAEPLLLSGYEGMVQREATIPAGYLSAPAVDANLIVTFYQSWRKPEEATEWKQKLQSSKRRMRPQTGSKS